jgi:hypothetical protein
MSTQIPWPLPHVSVLTDGIFDALRAEPKRKTSGTRAKEKMGHIEQQFELASFEVPDRHFRLFIRQSSSNSVVFSVGLTLVRPEGDLILCRYNSGHHGHKNILERERLPAACHQHILTERYVSAGLEHKGFAVLRTEYNSIDGALALLVAECNVANVTKHEAQTKLFP